MKMDHRYSNAALEVEKYSKLGTQDLQNNQLQRALESFKYAYKKSRELDDGYTERACAFNLGAVHIALGENRRGIEVLQKAMPPDNKREGSRSNGDLYFNFGLAYEGLGNSEEAVRNYKKALDEYKVERDNVNMEAETLEKIAQIYLKTGNRFAADTFDQLSQTYEILNNPAKQLWALSEKANQQFANELKDDAENTADECLKLAEKCDSSVNIGNIYNDLGLIYTQRLKYDRAVSCFELALPMVCGSHGDKKQEAVILQNLGATYNFLGDYQRAVQFHEEAANLYAQLKNRNSQGQCFANLAFAFSQLGDIPSAGEAFLHALQAAKDSGDKRTQWQVSEGLGAVAFNKGDIKRAIEYFKKALTLLAASDSSNSVAQDRIVTKLTLALQSQVTIETEQHPSREVQAKEYRTPVKESFIKKERVIPVSSAPTRVESSAEEPKRERFIPVARKGSSLRFQKVARGLSRDTISSARSTLSGSMEPISSDDSESESDEEDMDKTQHQMSETMQGRNSRSSSSANTSIRVSTKNAQGKGLHVMSTESSSSTSDAEEEESTKEFAPKQEEEEEKDAVQKEMKKQLQNLTGSSGSETEEEETNEVRKEQTKPKKVESESDSDSDSSVEEDAPPVPTQSPPQTSLLQSGTYETPKSFRKKQLHYADIDVGQSPKSGGERLHNKKTVHPNFLSELTDSSSKEEEEIQEEEDDLVGSTVRRNDGLQASGTYHEIEMGSMQEQKTNEDDPIYQTIPSRSETMKPQDDEADTPPLEESPQFKTISELPRGMNTDTPSDDKEAYHYEQHQKLVKEKQLKETITPTKESKTCSVM